MGIGSRGESRVSTLLYLLVAALVMYAGVKVLPPYLDYYSMEDEVYQQVKMAKINPDPLIRQDLLLKAKELEIDLDPKALKVSRDKNDRLQVYMEWQSRVDFGYGFTREFHFTLDTEKKDGE